MRILVGVGGYLTAPETLQLMHKHVKLKIYGQATGPLFHPKLYIFTIPRRDVCWIGSANLTQRGFTKNIEAVCEFEDEGGESLAAFEKLWKSKQSVNFVDFALNEYSKERQSIASKIPASIAKDLNVPFFDNPADKSSQIIQSDWQTYAEELKLIRPKDHLSVLAKRKKLIDRDWKLDLSPFDIQIMYGSRDYPAFGKLRRDHKEKFLGRQGKANRMKIGRALEQVLSLKSFDGNAAKGALQALLEIPGCGPALGTRLLALARPDWFVVVTKKSSEGLAKHFDKPGIKNLTPDKYAELLDVIHERRWCKSAQPVNQSERKLWQYRSALIDAIIYHEYTISIRDSI